MALIKKSELKQMNEKMLNEKLIELKKELIKINAQIAVGTPPEKPGRVKQMKRTIARINTYIKNKSGGNQKA